MTVTQKVLEVAFKDKNSIAFWKWLFNLFSNVRTEFI